jgi:hypothetical protein
MKRIAIILALCTTSAYVNSQSPTLNENQQSSVAVEVAVDNYADSALTDIDRSTMQAEEIVEAYINDNPSFGVSPYWIDKSVVSVKVDSAHRDWAKHRALAYKRAWADLQKKFVQTQQTVVEAEVIMKFYSDAAGNAPQFTPKSYTGSEAIDELIDKAGAYASGKLNNALENIGIDPAEYSRGSSKQRKILMEDSIQESSVKTTVGKIAGLWPLNTFVTEVNGEYAIGVVGLYHPKFEDAARQIASGKYPLPQKKPGRAPKDMVTQRSSELISNFGVRPLRDKMGYPALISFGQWGVSNLSRNPRIAATYRQAAIKQARNQADAQLAIFLNGSANATDKSFVGELEVSHTDVDRSGFNEESYSSSVEDIIDEIFTAKGRVKLSGLKDLRTWTYLDPKTGQTLVGVVRFWTVQNALDAKEISANRALSAKAKDKDKDKDKKSENSQSVTESLDLGDPTEF